MHYRYCNGDDRYDSDSDDLYDSDDYKTDEEDSFGMLCQFEPIL